MVVRGRYTPAGIIDISSGTNLAVTPPITLTGDTIGWDPNLADTDLLVWLRMDDVDGSGNPVDTGTLALPWTITNAARQIDRGVLGKGFQSDALGDWVDGGTPTGLPSGNSARTLSVWFRYSVAAT